MTKSYKTPQRILSILMFLSVIVVSIGPEGLRQVLPFASEATIVIIVGACAWLINQYNTEKRVEVAEELKEEEYSDGA